MATLDVFNTEAFSMLSMTAAVEKVPHLPMMLSDMGIFESVPVRTTSVFIEDREGVLSLIQTDARGAPPKQRTREIRTARNFSTYRIAQADTIRAEEVQNIRAFGSESEFLQVQTEVARRMSGPTGIMRNVEYTWENMRLGAVQGIVVDADGSTINNWFTEFNITQADEIDFDLDDATPESGEVRISCATVVRAMVRAAKGAWLPTSRVVGLCSDTFWDALIAHSEVRSTYLNQQEASQLRGPQAWQRLEYGGITFINYRGSDDNSTVAIPADKCKFFPVGAPGVFQTAWAPHDSLPFVNTLGRPMYANTIPDEKRQMGVEIEVYSYPLFYCTRPGMLQRAKLT